MTAIEPQPELLWRQYAQHVDLYKFYMEVAVKLMAFHYAITGAILSFYFAQPSGSTVRWALLLPLVQCLGIAIIFWKGASLLRVTRKDVFDLRDSLRLQVAPDFSFLGHFLQLFAGILVLTAIGVLALVVFRSLPPTACYRSCSLQQ